MAGRHGDTPRLRLADLIDLECQLAADEAIDPDELRQRDRAVGVKLRSAGGADRRALFLAWLEAVRDPRHPLPGERAVRSHGLATVLLIAFGFGAGALTAAGLFAYDGTHPVNVVHVLAVFVGAQLALLSLFVISALPQRGWTVVPGFAALQESLQLLSPGRWVDAVARLLPAEHRAALSSAWGRLRAFERLYGRVRLWSVARVAQGVGVAFNAGGVAAALSLIAFTDLAFAWSTTLEVGGASFHSLTSLLAAPWSSILPQAVPSAELVESTRYFRLTSSYGGAGGLRAVDAAGSGGWWPFLLACMLAYGLLPRLLTWIVAGWRLRAALDRVRLDHAGYEHLYERLTEVLVETRSPEEEHPHLAAADSGGGDAAPLPHGGTMRVIVWGTADLSQSAAEKLVSSRLGCSVAQTFQAGGMDVGADEAALEEIGRARNGPVCVLLPSYEAPTRDLRNFLAGLRRALGDGAMIVVVPFDTDGAGHCIDSDPEDLRQWRRSVRSLGDPWIRLAAAP